MWQIKRTRSDESSFYRAQNFDYNLLAHEKRSTSTTERFLSSPEATRSNSPGMWWPLVELGLVLLAEFLLALKAEQWRHLVHWLEVGALLHPRVQQLVHHSEHEASDKTCDEDGSSRPRGVGEKAPDGQYTTNFSEIEKDDEKGKLARESGSKAKAELPHSEQKQTSEVTVTTFWRADPDTWSCVEKTRLERDNEIVTKGAASDRRFTTVLINWVPAYKSAPHIQNE